MIWQLREKIKNKEYERLPEETKSNNYKVISEKVLQILVLEDIESFMKELGYSFSFIGSEYKIKIGDRYKERIYWSNRSIHEFY